MLRNTVEGTPCTSASKTHYHNAFRITDLSLQGAALGTMVGQLSYGKRQFESLDGRMRELIPVLHKAMNDLLPLVDADTEAFNHYMVLAGTT